MNLILNPLLLVSILTKIRPENTLISLGEKYFLHAEIHVILMGFCKTYWILDRPHRRPVARPSSPPEPPTLSPPSPRCSPRQDLSATRYDSPAPAGSQVWFSPLRAPPLLRSRKTGRTQEGGPCSVHRGRGAASPSRTPSICRAEPAAPRGIRVENADRRGRKGNSRWGWKSPQVAKAGLGGPVENRSMSERRWDRWPGTDSIPTEVGTDAAAHARKGSGAPASARRRCCAPLKTVKLWSQSWKHSWSSMKTLIKKNQENNWLLLKWQPTMRRPRTSVLLFLLGEPQFSS